MDLAEAAERLPPANNSQRQAHRRHRLKGLVGPPSHTNPSAKRAPGPQLAVADADPCCSGTCAGLVLNTKTHEAILGVHKILYTKQCTQRDIAMAPVYGGVVVRSSPSPPQSLPVFHLSLSFALFRSLFFLFLSRLLFVCTTAS